MQEKGLKECVICENGKVAISNNNRTKEWLCVNCLIKNAQLEAKRRQKEIQNDRR